MLLFFFVFFFCIFFFESVMLLAMYEFRLRSISMSSKHVRHVTHNILCRAQTSGTEVSGADWHERGWHFGQIYRYIHVWSPQRSHILGDIPSWNYRKPLATCSIHRTYPSAVSNTVRSLLAIGYHQKVHNFCWSKSQECWLAGLV